MIDLRHLTRNNFPLLWALTTASALCLVVRVSVSSHSALWRGALQENRLVAPVILLFGATGVALADEQRAFFNEIQRRYDSLWPEILKVLETQASRLEIKSREFVVVCVDLPAPGREADRDWALSYETKPPSWHFTVQMKAWAPAEVVAEC